MELKTICAGANSLALTVFFQTDGCCSYPEDILISNVLANQINLKVSKVTGAIGYRVCLKETKTGVCALDKTFADTAFVVNNLKSCQNYTMTVQTSCGVGALGNDTTLYFRTKGCGACYDSIYCRSSGSSANE